MVGRAKGSGARRTTPDANAVREAARGRADVDRYLAAQPAPHRRALRHLRALIRKAAPKATELVSYGMPAFRQDGMLVFYAGFRDHLSFFVAGPKTRQRFARELLPYTVGKATTQFLPDHPLPDALVLRIVRSRVAENRDRRAARTRGRTRSSRGL